MTCVRLKLYRVIQNYTHLYRAIHIYTELKKAVTNDICLSIAAGDNVLKIGTLYLYHGFVRSSICLKFISLIYVVNAGHIFSYVMNAGNIMIYDVNAGHIFSYVMNARTP